MRKEPDLDYHRQRLESTLFQDPIHFSMFQIDDEIPSWAISSVEACGEDCDECEIPKELKQLSDTKKVDIMAFLGIYVAQPLEVVTRQNSKSLDWE
jgi:hypothetical protein